MYHARTLRSETHDVVAASAAHIVPGRSDLERCIEAVWNGRGLIGLAMALAIPLGLAVGMGLTPRYAATTQLLIDPVDLQVVEKGLKSSSSQYGDIQIAQVETQGRVLTSRNVLKPVIEQQGLMQDPEFVKGDDGAGEGILARLKSYLPGKAEKGEPNPLADALRSLQKRIVVKRADRTFVLDVSVMTSDPEKSVRLANAVVDSFLEERGQSLAEAARRATGSLTERLAEMKQRVEIAERAVQDFKASNAIVSSSGLLVTEQQLSALNQQLVLFRVQAAEAKARVEQLRQLQREGGDAGALPDAIRSQALATLRAQYSDARGKEGQLAAALLPGHPSIAAARGQANNIRAAIREEVGRIVVSAESEHLRASRQEKALEGAIAKLERELTETNERMLRLRELERDAQAQRTVYEGFLVRTGEIGAQEKLDVVNARVISRADQADRTGWPPRTWQVVLLLMIVAASLAMLWLAVRALQSSRAPTAS